MEFVCNCDDKAASQTFGGKGKKFVQHNLTKFWHGILKRELHGVLDEKPPILPKEKKNKKQAASASLQLFSKENQNSSCVSSTFWYFLLQSPSAEICSCMCAWQRSVVTGVLMSILIKDSSDDAALLKDMKRF